MNNQSVMQNGYSILTTNDSGMDQFLLAKDYLLSRINTINEKKLYDQQSNIAERGSIFVIGI